MHCTVLQSVLFIWIVFLFEFLLIVLHCYLWTVLKCSLRYFDVSTMRFLHVPFCCTTFYVMHCTVLQSVLFIWIVFLFEFLLIVLHCYLWTVLKCSLRYFDVSTMRFLHVPVCCTALYCNADVLNCNVCRASVLFSAMRCLLVFLFAILMLINTIQAFPEVIISYCFTLVYKLKL